MLQVSQKEAAALRQKDGNTLIAITSKKKKGCRKHYYVEENQAVRKFLAWFRRKEEKIIYSKGVNA